MNAIRGKLEAFATDTDIDERDRIVSVILRELFEEKLRELTPQIDDAQAKASVSQGQ